MGSNVARGQVVNGRKQSAIIQAALKKREERHNAIRSEFANRLERHKMATFSRNDATMFESSIREFEEVAIAEQLQTAIVLGDLVVAPLTFKIIHG